MEGVGDQQVVLERERGDRIAVDLGEQHVAVERAPHIHVLLSWVAPDKRKRDADNLVGTLKPCIDALTEAGLSRGWPCTPMVPDDDPAHVSWSPPRILAPDGGGPRLWLTVTALSRAPEPGEGFA